MPSLPRRRTLGLFVVALVLLYAMLSWIARRTIYYPMRYPAGLWDQQAACGAEDCWLRSADNVRLHA